ncbi:MAG: PaaI family thioesterase [Sulfitobacter sp.]
MTLPPNENPRLIHDETGTQRLIGYVVDVRDAGCAKVWLDLGKQHLNRHGVMHGGIAATLLDSASGTAGSLSVDVDGKVPFLTISLTTQFVAPGRTGRVTATANVTGGGRNLLYISGELRHEDGTLIATSTGVFKRVPPDKLT